MEHALAGWNELLAQDSGVPFFMYSSAAAARRLVNEFKFDLTVDQAERLEQQADALYQAATTRFRASRPGRNAPPAAWRTWSLDANRMGELAGGLGRHREAITWFSESIMGEQRADTTAGRTGRVLLPGDVALCAEPVAPDSDYRSTADAFSNYAAWRDLLAEAVRARGKDLRNSRRLAQVCVNLGLARRDAGRSNDALNDLEQARSVWEELSGDPSEFRLRRLARIHVEIGRIHDRARRFAQAIESFTRARDFDEALARRAPTDPRYRAGIACCDHVIAGLHEDLQQFAPAESFYRRALDLREALAREFPQNAKFASDRDGTKRNLAELRALLARL
jgi:tetratricopeptide (TPR) repeat protein